MTERNQGGRDIQQGRIKVYAQQADPVISLTLPEDFRNLFETCSVEEQITTLIGSKRVTTDRCNEFSQAGDWRFGERSGETHELTLTSAEPDSARLFKHSTHTLCGNCGNA